MEEPQDCASCEKPRYYDDLDEEGICEDCREAAEDRRQLESDYRFWVL